MHEVSDAVRVRSMLAVSSELHLARSGAGGEVESHLRHVTLPDGSLLLRTPDAGDGVPLTSLRPGELLLLSVVDVASTPQPDRVRGRMRMRGTLAPWTGARPEGVLTLLRGDAPAEEPLHLSQFRPVGVEVAWRREGAVAGPAPWRPVDLADYRAAAPDSMVAQEQRWLPHLQRDHAETLHALAARAVPHLGVDTDVRALALDRFGVTLRLYAARAAHDVRLAFPTPVGCGCDLREAFSALVGQTTA